MANNEFVAQTVVAAAAAPAQSASDQMKTAVTGAKRLSTDFRFRSGSKELDNKAIVDLDRVVSTLTDLNYSGKNVILLGFADSSWNAGSKQQIVSGASRYGSGTISQKRGDSVDYSRIWRREPVAGNDTPQGREKNRRVEIWVKN